MIEGDLVLFDGECGLCSRSVKLIVRYDSGGRFKFAAIDSVAGRRALEGYGGQLEDVQADTFYYVCDGVVYTESEGALRVASRLDGWVRLLGVFLILPMGLRDAVYRWVARRRYAFFGKVEEGCLLADDEVRGRLLE